MKKLCFLFILFSAMLYVLPTVQAQNVVTMTIDAQQKGPETSPYQYGLFFEEINHAGDGGLYAELIRNRSFEDSYDWPENWWTVGEATFGVTEDNPLNSAQKYSLWLTINSASEANPAGVANEGFWGMNIVAGRTYHLTFFMRQNEGNFTGRLRARLLSEDRSAICGEAVVEGQPVTSQWVKLSATITATSNAPKGCFALMSTTKGKMQLDVVSLFPPTWKNRPNGLRPELAQLLADTHPSFLRFPGGCYVEGAGDSYENAFQWKRTIGPIEQRPGHWNYNWGYRSSDGLGFDEYLQLCEDLGAAPMFVVNVGLGHDYFIPLDQMQPLVQDALDAIEYANGDASTTWGARRIANGHAAPYNLKFIEIGNENYQSDWDVEQPRNPSYQYPERYEMFRQAISSRYPDLVLIGNVEAWGTDYPTWRNKYPVNLVDEHYYRHYTWMQQNYHKYDSYDRSLGINVYNGEYAANGGDYGNYGNVNSALGEAVYMLGMERNSDVCRMASFAPIFMHENDGCWPYDMIHFNAAATFCTPSYYIQQLLPEYLGKQNLLWTDEGNVASNLSDNYHAGVATWNTAASFKDFTVTDLQGNTLLNDNFASGTANWRFNTTGWQTAGGMLQQHEMATDCRAVNLTDISTDNYIVQLKARKDDGAEGFLIIFNYQDEENFCWWNLGGWENKRHGVEWCNNGDKSTVADVAGSIEQGRWYDVEIQVNGSSVTCKLDGQVVHHFTLPVAHHIYQSVQLSEDGSHLYVKAVNPAKNAVTLNLNLKNMQATGGRTVVLKGLSGTDENTMEQPNLVVPTDGGTLGSNLSNITLPPYSLSIFDIDVTDEQNAPIQGEDLTTWVGTSQEDWHAWGVCATNYAPAITTSDGRNAQMMETYEETTETTGELMWQEVTGLPNGRYRVELYANAMYTSGRGFDSALEEGASDVAYLQANNSIVWMKAYIGTEVEQNSCYTIFTDVTDGTLRLSITAAKPGTNWHTIQIKRLVLLAEQQSQLKAADVTTRSGKQVELPISLSNEKEGENVVGVSFTLKLPEGVTVAVDEDGDPVVQLLKERINTKQFNVTTAQYEDSSWGIRVYTTTSTGVFKSTEGDFMTMLLNVDERMAEGDYDILLADNKLSVRKNDNSVKTVIVKDTSSKLTIDNVLLGDVNSDGEVDLSDAIMVTYYSLHINPANFLVRAADMNGDGEIDLSDAITIIYKSLGVLDSRPMKDDNLTARQAEAREHITISDITVGQGGETDLDICYKLEDDGNYVGFMFIVDLPEGLSLAKDPEDPDYPWYDDEVSAISKLSITTTTNNGFAATPKKASSTVNGKEGVLMRLKVKAADALAPGTYTAKLTELSFNLRDENYNVTKSKLDDVQFNVIVNTGENAGIEDVNAHSSKSGAHIYYDLQGRKVPDGKLKSGLYIQGGRLICIE